MYFQKPPLGTPLDWSNPLNDACILHLAMNEGNGDKVQDLSMNGNHGTLNNFAFPSTVVSGWNPGRTGVGLNFDGTNDHIQVPHHESINIGSTGSSYSASLLVYIDDVTTEQGIIDKRSGADGPLYIRVVNDICYAYIRKDFPTHNHVVNENISIGWNHIVFVKNTNIKLYINGVSTTHTSVDNVDYRTTTPITIGMREGTAIPLNGCIDNPRIYNRALSAKEVEDYYINPWQVYLDE